jgi:uncharacterized protein YnzC (UPF0291/DUF896 family)
MPFLSNFSKSLKKAFSQIEKTQAEALAIEISANFIAGRTAGEKHKSIQSAEPEDPEDEGLTEEEKAEIAVLAALYLGYLSKFNDIAQAQILTTTKELIEQAGGQVTPEVQDEIKKRLDDVLDGREKVVIDNVGKVRKELYVDKNLKLSEVEKVITKKYSASVKTYSELLGEQASHASYEAGRKAQLIGQGFDKWVFVGPADERARPWHVALLGQVFTWNTEQSSYAERCLQEPRCRHRAAIWYGDPKKDTPKEKWEKLKNDAGLYFDDAEQMWKMRE